jgi:energy-converting hydrogenase Eha subunit E
MISELEDVAALTLVSLPNEESLDIYTFFQTATIITEILLKVVLNTITLTLDF